jgi:hypothetical protein
MNLSINDGATPTQPLYIQYLGSWGIHPHNHEGTAILEALPQLSDRQSRAIAKDGRRFAEYLRDNKLGKLVTNLTSIVPALREVALDY